MNAVSRPASAPLHAVRVLHDVRIPVRDGLELSANLFLPEPLPGRPGHPGRPVHPAASEAPPERFPAILGMDPYRKDDWSAGWDLSLGTYLAERGYVLCRLDVRGTGSSPGIAVDEYAEAETTDGYDAVEWLAAQPWCDGNVGMWGISYGGFTSLQVAALRPPHLRAIVPVYATDDRYTDDVHYIGGCMTVSELSQYAVSQVAMNALPPRPAQAGSDWQERWRERLEATPIWLFEWARRQRDGAYWRRGSLAPAYERIEAAVLQIAGWRDGYVDAAFRIQERCIRAAERRTIVGDWVHMLPDSAYPGPRMDWLHEMVRFFDRWLKGGEDRGGDEPAFVWYRREYQEPVAFPSEAAGAWQAEASWPPDRTIDRALLLDGGDVSGRGSLVAGTAPAAIAPPGVDTYHHCPASGTHSSLSWGSGHRPNGLARDLRPDEAAGPTYTSPPLEAPLDILGFPRAVLHLASSAPIAHLVVRLSDVAPDGAASQVSAGILNLSHRRSHRDLEPMEPGCVEEVTVPLRAAGYRFLPGHRIRLSVASAWWPVIWPSPLPATFELHRGGARPSRLLLPVLPSESAFQPPPFRVEPPALRRFADETEDEPLWRVTDDVLAGTVTVNTFEGGTSVLPDGTSLYLSETLEMAAHASDPTRASFDNRCVYRLVQDGHEVETVATGLTRAGETAFDMEVALDVRLDGEPFFHREQAERIPRDLV